VWRSLGPQVNALLRLGTKADHHQQHYQQAYSPSKNILFHYHRFFMATKLQNVYQKNKKHVILSSAAPP
jgi:hypothetical protein